MRNKQMVNKFVNSHEFYLSIVVIALTVFFAVATNGLSVSADNLLNMIISYSYLGIMAMGVLVVIISGGIDLSFMVTATISQYVMAIYILNNPNTNILFSIIISLCVGILLGLINAVLVHFLKAPTMIITIATMNIFFGLLMYITDGARLFDFPKWFSTKTPLKMTYMAVGILVFAIVLTAVLLQYTKMGRKVLAIGGNLEAAKRAGVNILLVHLVVYGFVGAMSALGGTVHLYTVQQAAPNALYGKELNVISMAVLGGVNLAGGKGSVFGTILGMLLVAIMSNGLLLIGISSYWQTFFIGAVILVSFSINGWRNIGSAEKLRKGGKISA